MGNFLLEGKIEGIAKVDKGFVVALSNEKKLVVNGDVLLAAAVAVSGSKKKGGNIEGTLNTALKGKTLVLAIK